MNPLAKKYVGMELSSIVNVMMGIDSRVMVAPHNAILKWDSSAPSKMRVALKMSPLNLKFPLYPKLMSTRLNFLNLSWCLMNKPLVQLICR